MILETYEFSSCFAPYITQLINQKHDEGFIYDSAKYILIQFDRFCLDKKYTEPLVTKELTMDWGTLREGEARVTLGGRMSVLRQLALYMCSLGKECYIPSKFSAKSHTLAYVMSESEIQAFFHEADSYISGIDADRFNRLSMEYKVLFRFIFCCGLRVSEARKLKLKDVDFSEKKAIIRQSKGCKDRIIFISEDIAELCIKYLKLLRDRYGIDSELLFPAAAPQKPLQAESINKKFHDFWKRTPYSGNDEKQPTVHSLRHSFVVIRMNKWMEQEESLNALMPYLSKYLGHASVDDTFYYYHQVESAFKIIRKKDVSSSAIIPEVDENEK